MFDLEEKVSSQRFSSDRVVRMEGKGRRTVSEVNMVCMWKPDIAASCFPVADTQITRTEVSVTVGHDNGRKDIATFLCLILCFLYFLDLTYEFIQRGGLRDPIIIEKPDGLGIK